MLTAAHLIPSKKWLTILLMSKLKKFSANAQGIDYICADIHGHFSLLDGILQNVGFDSRRDRVFCLGDLIDRGDESARALEYLAKPWFYSLMGNHELMLIKACESQSEEVFEWWYYWGGEWANGLSAQDLKQYSDIFKRLPVAMELTLRNGSHVALVHAELPVSASWDAISELLSAIPEDEWRLEDYKAAPMVWSKNIVFSSEKEQKKIKPIQNIEHVFHGHSIVYCKPLTIGNRTYMDLGSYETGEIGFLDPVEFLTAN